MLTTRGNPRTVRAMTLRRIAPVLFLVVGSLIFSLPAQEDVAPVNVEAILRDLDQIEVKQQEVLDFARNSAVTQIKEAVSNPSSAKTLYQKAVEELQFAGISGKGAAFVDWKKSMTEVFRNNEFQTALQLHLKYLVLSLEQGGSDKPERFVVPSFSYAIDLAGTEKGFIDFKQNLNEASKKDPYLKQAAKLCDELLNKPLSASPFVTWLRIESLLPKKGWEMVPGNLSGILEKNVRPEMRKAADPRLVGTWELEMEVEAARATAGGRDHVATDYNAVKGPKLRFARAKDIAVLGQKNRAVTEVYALVKEFPRHPDFGTWVSELRAMLTPPPAVVPAPAQP